MVDDSPTNRRILNDVLTLWNMRPTLAASGAEALAVLRDAHQRAERFDLVLLDVQMPAMDGFEVAEAIRMDVSIDAPPIVMLSSTGCPSDIERCRHEAAAYVGKPITQLALFQTLATVLGNGNTHPQGTPEVPSEPGQALPPSRPLTILLAEDNVVNQRVAQRMLEKRGHTIVVVGNGREAVAAAATQRFDVILMDIQMPEMDGLVATAAIREAESAIGVHTAIIAMTAHAMKGDAERYLRAGMDDYLSKPIHPSDLLAAVARCAVGQDESAQPCETNWGDNELAARSTATAFGATHEPAEAMAGDDTHVFDLEALLARVEDDWDLLLEMVDLYLGSSPKLLAEMSETLEHGDLVGLERLAHGLKGALQNISALSAAEAAADLEEMGRRGNVAAAAASLARLEAESIRLRRVLPRDSLETT